MKVRKAVTTAPSGLGLELILVPAARPSRGSAMAAARRPAYDTAHRTIDETDCASHPTGRVHTRRLLEMYSRSASTPTRPAYRAVPRAITRAPALPEWGGFAPHITVLSPRGWSVLVSPPEGLTVLRMHHDEFHWELCI